MREIEVDGETIRVEVERGRAGLFYATSPDVPGFLAAERSEEAALAAVPDCVRALRKGLAEAQWIAEARNLIAEHGHEVEWDADIDKHRIDGMPVTDGQLTEMAFALGKAPLGARQ